MPSVTEAQARLMAARAHGWNPPHPHHKLPSVSVAKEFNQADKGSALLSHAMKHRYASGGLAMFNQNPNYLSALATRGGLQGMAATPPAMARPQMGVPARPVGMTPASTAPTQSALSAALQPRMGVPGSRPMGALPTAQPIAPMAPGALGQVARPIAHYALGGPALGGDSLAQMPSLHLIGGGMHNVAPGMHMRMPRIPIADTMRNIDQKIGHASMHLKRLAAGGPAPAPAQLGPEGAQAVQKALEHLKAGNASGAIQSLSDSRQAMSHPLVAAAARHLANANDVPAAHAVLHHVANQHAHRQFQRQNAAALQTAAQLPAGPVAGQ